jgi:hypothetical protein
MARGEDIRVMMHHIKCSPKNCRLTAPDPPLFDRASYDPDLNHESIINLIIIFGCMVARFSL